MFCHAQPHLRGVCERDGIALAEEIAGPILYVNAAMLPGLKYLARLKELIKQGDPFLAVSDQRVTAALCPRDFPSQLATRNASELPSYILDQRLPIVEDEFITLEHTFDVTRHHERLIGDHLEHLIEQGSFHTIAENVHVGTGADIASNVVFDTDDGPIVIGNNVRIRPFSYVAGPVRIGDNCLIIDHASIKHATVLGHTVKAGGEIEAAIIEPFSNKQHHGFLGHAYVGSWVNLGAGTSNSDLKNTYGEIAIDVDGRQVQTKLQFLGCVIGDYTKTAINTSIFTGKLIGVSSFLYGFISTNVPSFTNYARSFGQVTEVSVDVAIKTQSRAASRRKVTMSSVDTVLMQELFELTRPERQLSSEQVVL
jgi:glucose-1-phosphate thymidylyltransferase